MQLAKVSLDDKYTLECGRIFVTGSQALVRLPMLQRMRDMAAGWNTAGYISGYRGSPLGGYDFALWRAERHLREHHIRFQPGVNEDLAATAAWGTQQVGLGDRSEYDGVFAIWYGKGPGVDRTGDVFKHGNLAGTSEHGGVLVLFGDDPVAKSSTVAHQSEPNLIAANIPVLNPASVQEYLDYGVLAFELSRYSGCWVGMKCVTETVESSASVYVDPQRVRVKIPTDLELPPDGLNIRQGDMPVEQEKRLIELKLPAVLAFARANKLDHVTHDVPAGKRRLGIVTSGKSWADLVAALGRLGIDDAMRNELGLTIYKVAMPWPLEPEGIREYAQDHEALLVVEEKRGLIEEQLVKALYTLPNSPRIFGKQDEQGRPLVPAYGELSEKLVAELLRDWLIQFQPPASVVERLQRATSAEAKLQKLDNTDRMAWFCAGCPHNTSTKVPEGSRAFAGIGCHAMALFMPNRRTETFTHMGGEGAQWIGQAPFSKDKHVFQNLGDGTYYHSGVMAIRAAVAAKVNITYKLLFNDAVAMTGGQPVDGQQTPWGISQQLAAEGVKKIVVVTDDPDKYSPGTRWANGVTIRHRRELEAVQRELRETEGTTVLLYDQTCAAELRRRRKRGLHPDPAKRVFINEAVCEGCGDCGIASNCVAVKPLETEFGRKREIDQSSCNKDFSCVEGFCPSFVTVLGGDLKKTKVQAAGADLSSMLSELPIPQLGEIDQDYNILVTGIGGSGVVTIGALLGMAAHLEGKGVSVLDQTGMAQKNGAVTSHVRLAKKPEALHSTRISAGKTDLVLGCDMVVAASVESQETYKPGRTRAVINDQVVPIAAFALNPDMPMDGKALTDSISATIGKESTYFVAAAKMATALMGDAIYTNPFLMGYAWQQGLIPLRLESVERAIELNGVAVEANKQAFGWGRCAAYAPDRVMALVQPKRAEAASSAEKTLEELIAHRKEHLTAYQNAAYAKRYETLVRKVQEAEQRIVPGEDRLARAVAWNYSKLMAYKDEYEVARLYAQPAFRERLESQFEGGYKLKVHLAPPLFAKTDPITKKPIKSEYGAWIFKAFGLLSSMRFLRGTPLDLFGYTSERKMERELIREYENTIDELLQILNADNHELAVELASIPESIRGFGHVKDRHLLEAKKKEKALWTKLQEQPKAVDSLRKKA